MGAVGRAGELETITSWLRAAAADAHSSSGSNSVLVIEGEPGIGKTTVWAEATRHARVTGWTVLACRPRPSDAPLAHLGLTDLLVSVPDQVFRDLPTPQRRPLEVATLRREAGGNDLEPRAVGTALTAVLRRVADRGPLLLAVDDAQWLDRASASSLAFALHRLDDRAVRLIAAVRVEGPARPPSVVDALESTVGHQQVHRLALGPLSIGAMHQVFLDVLGASLTRPVLVRIHKAAAGNPFYALEIAREVERLGTPPPGRPLPVPEDHRDLVLQRLRRLPRATRGVLAEVAALSRPVAADLDLDALAPAERAEVVHVQPDGRVDFAHPLFGSLLYASLPEVERRGLHRRLAERVESLEERARHLALAASGPDAVSAEVLDRAAEAAGSRGAAEVAVELKELAVRLTPPADREAVVRRALELARRRYFAGDATGARRDLNRLLPTVPSGEARAEVLLELGSVVWNQGENDDGLRLVSEALLEASTPSLQAKIHARASALAEDCDVAVEHAEAALALIDEHEEPLLYSFALHNLARWKMYSGRGADHEALEKGMRLQRELAGWEVSTVPAFWARDFDDFDTARHRFHEMLRVFREQGDEASSSSALAQLAVIEALTGRLERARRYADEALDLAHQTEQDLWINVALNAQGQVHVRSGNLEAARAAAGEALRRIEVQPDTTIECMVRAVLGLAALSAGDVAEADRQLSRSDELLAIHHTREPAPDRFQADHAEAVIALGDLDRAESLVARMEERAEKIPRPWILATSARCRGLLLSARGDLDGAVTALRSATTHHEHLDMPFERARTSLALGQVLRRRNERRAARVALEEALRAFEQLGVTPWVERTRAELARVPVRHAPSDLTPAEQAIARLASAGLTNREVAERAFVSAKTVEANLARVYAKLGIHSRAELGRVMLERERTGKT